MIVHFRHFPPNLDMRRHGESIIGSVVIFAREPKPIKTMGIICIDEKV